MIRLRRAGGRNRPFYRVVVIDSRRARDSRAVEEIGFYDPLETPAVIQVDRERVSHWKDKGAQVSDSVRSLLKNENSAHLPKRTLQEFVADAPVASTPKPSRPAKPRVDDRRPRGGPPRGGRPKAPAAEAPQEGGPAVES